MTNPEPVVDFTDVEPDSIPEMKTPLASVLKEAAKKTVPPKTTRAPSSSKAAQDREMETAIKVMQNLYDAVAVGLLFASPAASKMWVEKIERLNASNESAFAADADLRRAVVRFGSVSGKAAFITAHATAVIPVTFVAYADVRSKRSPKPAPVKNVPAEEAVFYPREETRPGAYPNQHLFE